jgi:hypothetical protein
MLFHLASSLCFYFCRGVRAENRENTYSNERKRKIESLISFSSLRLSLLPGLLCPAVPWLLSAWPRLISRSSLSLPLPLSVCSSSPTAASLARRSCTMYLPVQQRAPIVKRSGSSPGRSIFVIVSLSTLLPSTAADCLCTSVPRPSSARCPSSSSSSSLCAASASRTTAQNTSRVNSSRKNGPNGAPASPTARSPINHRRRNPAPRTRHTAAQPPGQLTAEPR